MAKTLEEEVIQLISSEKDAWETETAFVTEKVAFQMRNLIRQLRKNYYGIFESPTNPQTGQKKIWIPLTESTVEAVVKNIDLDTKDIKVMAKQPDKTKIAFLVRELIKLNLDKIDFGEKLNDAERRLAIDGTVVWKINKTNKDGETLAEITPVDLLNFYIDPVAKSIQDTPAVIERAVISMDEFEAMDGWTNKEDVKGSTNLDPNDGENQVSAQKTGGEIPSVEIFERWGLMPKSFLTGKKADKNIYINSHIVVSGLGSQNSERVHLVEEVKDDLKPYEECWYTRVPGRWYGRGIGEKLLMLQLYINLVVNTRITRAIVSQLGLFKIRRGAKITAQMLRNLPVNGAIKVDTMEDIEQIVMQEASQSSYTDEENAMSWSQRVTQAFEISTGEEIAATTTATVGAISQRSAQSGYALVKEGIGLWLERVLKRHLVPIIKKNIKKEQILRITLDIDEIQQLDNQLIDGVIADYLEDMESIGEPVTQEQLDAIREQIQIELNKKGKDRYFSLFDDLDIMDYDVGVYVSNEQIDKNLLVTDLLNMLKIVPSAAEQIIPQVFDMLGLNINLNSLKQQGAPTSPITPTTENKQMMEANSL